MTKRLLMPYQVAEVRERRVQYSEVTMRTMQRAAFCRCCGQPVTKGEAALHFYWDFNGNGSWTVTGCYMHAACEPAPEEVRKPLNRAALIEELHRRLTKLEGQWHKAGPKVQQRVDREIDNIEEHLRQLEGAQDREAKL